MAFMLSWLAVIAVTTKAMLDGASDTQEPVKNREQCYTCGQRRPAALTRHLKWLPPYLRCSAIRPNLDAHPAPVSRALPPHSI